MACEIIGTLIANNTSLDCLDLHGTGLGQAIASDTEGGNILLQPFCQSKECPLRELDLSSILLSDKGGAKLFSSLFAGLGKRALGYDKIVRLNLSGNQMGKASSAVLKEIFASTACTLQHINLSANPALEGVDP
eukprot:4620934-Prymnesium_polylepis.1